MLAYNALPKIIGLKINLNTLTSRSILLHKAESYLPALLPFLLLFSRSLADISVVLISLLFLYKSYIEQSWQWAQLIWFRFALLFVAYLVLINTPFSIDSTTSFGKALAFLRWPIFASAIAFWLLHTQQRLRHFIIGLIIASVFVAVDTTWQYFMGVDLFGFVKHNADRLTGPFRSPIPGTMMIRLIFLLLLSHLVFGWLRTSSRQITFNVFILTIGTVFIFITGERMALLLFTFGSVIILTGMSFEWKQHRKLMFFSAILASLVLFHVAWLFPDTTQRSIYSAFLKLSQFRQSDYYEVFSAGYRVWLTAPIVGIGYENYQTVCEQMQLTNICSHPHNLYIHLASETGLLGLGLFSVFIMTLFHSVVVPTIKRQQWFLAAIVCAILLMSFWPFTGGISILSNWIAALVWLGVGLCLAISQHPLLSNNVMPLVE